MSTYLGQEQNGRRKGNTTSSAGAATVRYGDSSNGQRQGRHHERSTYTHQDRTDGCRGYRRHHPYLQDDDHLGTHERLLRTDYIPIRVNYISGETPFLKINIKRVRT